MELVILGNNELGQKVKSIAQAIGWYDSIHFLDDIPGPETEDCFANFVLYMADDTAFYPAFEDNERRVAWMNRLMSLGCGLASLIHPDAKIAPEAVILPGVIADSGVVIGRGTRIKTAVLLEKDAWAGSYCILEAGSRLKQNATLPDHACTAPCDTILSRRERAMNNFRQGYNCSQSIALAFSDLTPMDPDMLSSLASPFGGGMGRLREVCGAFSGMLMITGLLSGYSGPETGEPKKALYAKVQHLADLYTKENGSIVCRELLGRTREAPTPEQRTESYYAKRPCCEIIGRAAEILDQMLRSGHSETD